jgi:protein TonB
MFAELLLDSHRIDRSRRGWATLTSFGVQAILVTCIMTLPLIYTQVMPLAMPASILLTVPHGDPSPVSQPPEHVPANPGAGSGSHTAAWIVPIQIPSTIYTGPDAGPVVPPDIGPVGVGPASGPYVPFATGPGPAPVIPRAPDFQKPIKISHISEGSLLTRVEPVYPPIAKSAGIQGPVELEAVIGRDGRIENLQVLSGHPMLVRAAADAVLRWRYRPYVLNGEAVEVETRITVNFILAR